MIPSIQPWQVDVHCTTDELVLTVFPSFPFLPNNRYQAAIPSMKSRCITVNGFSKSYGMTGYRLGYLAADKEVCVALAVCA